MDLQFDQALLSGWGEAVLFGMWFGTLHALDADHVATIGGIALGHRSISPVEYALRWAAGHAAALAAIAVAAVALGLARATALAVPAEALVAAALVAIGGQVVWAAPQRLRAACAASVACASASGRMLVTQTQRAPVHAGHPAAPSQPSRRLRRLRRAGVVLGLVHGSAGSAAVLALLPLAQFGAGTASALYLACFSLGVATGAVAFAALFTRFAARATAAGAAVGTCLQLLVGAFAIASGALLLVGLSLGNGGG